MKQLFCLLVFLGASLFAESWAQTNSCQTVELYLYAKDNSGLIADANIRFWRPADSLSYRLKTDSLGRCRACLPLVQKEYQVQIQHKIFSNQTFSLQLDGSDSTIYKKVGLDRLPGYLLELSITEFLQGRGDSLAAGEYSLEGVTIEIYNKTQYKQELRLVEHPHHEISFLMEQGNEYIFMLRKQGYYSKRMRANVNVNDCILCMEGFGELTPGVAESLTQDNSMGTLVSNVNLRPLAVGEKMKLDNIYYDYGSSQIRPESYATLDQLAEMMRDNPNVYMELSAHTDCRGSKAFNLELSQNRANNVVQYIQERLPNGADRVKAQGYGESKPLNSCIDGISCSEELHQQNRRTELLVLDVVDDEDYINRPLASIMQEELESEILAANNSSYFKEKDPSQQKAQQKPTIPGPIPPNYSGYKIELSRSQESPALDHPIFMAFSTVFLDIDEQGFISFMVGDYSSEEEVNKALDKFRSRFSKAKAVYYKLGIRQ